MAGEAAKGRKRSRNDRNSLICYSVVLFMVIYAGICIYYIGIGPDLAIEEFTSTTRNDKNNKKISSSRSRVPFAATYAMLNNLRLNILERFSENTGIIKTPVSRLVRKSQDTGMFLHNDKGQLLCGTTTSKVLILVFSNYKELGYRMSIRHTWASKVATTNKYIKQGRQALEFKWRKLFVISRAGEEWDGSQFVRTELLMQPDILEVEIQEHPSKGAMKLYSALRWALNNCNFQYLMYTNAQHFVNLPVLYNFFHRADIIKIKDLYAGHLVRKSIHFPNLTRHLERKFLPKNENEFIEGDSGAILSRSSLETIINDLAYISTSLGSTKPDIMIAAAMHHHKILAKSVSNFVKKLDCSNHCCLNSKGFILVYETKSRCFNELFKNYN